jgi:hypothetical protein
VKNLCSSGGPLNDRGRHSVRTFFGNADDRIRRNEHGLFAAHRKDAARLVSADIVAGFVGLSRQ